MLDAGTATRGGREGVRLDLGAPARLVLAESFNRGRRASCDGRDLGEPEVGALFGTAWRVPADCREVEIAFAPNRLVNAGYAISLVVAVILLAVVSLGGVARRRARRRREGAAPRRRGGGVRGRGGRCAAASESAAATSAGDAARAADGGALAMPARRAALLAVPVALALGFVFAARATPLFWLGVFVVLWRGIGARALALAGGALLGLAVPLLYVLVRPENRGGYNPEYAIDLIAAHWVAVAGVALFMLALSRAMGRPGRARSAPPTAADPPPPGP